MAFVTVKVEPGTPPPWIEEGMEQTRKNRFKLMNDVEFDDFMNSIDGKKTKEVERFAMGVFQSYMEEAHLKASNETDNNADADDESRKTLDATLLLADDFKLDEIVAQFFPSARTKRGEYYSKNTIILIRFSLSRYLKKLKNVDITDPTKFPKACMSFRAAVKMLKKEGKISKPHKAVSDEDMQKIQASLDLDDNVGLQRKVFIDIMLYFCIRGGGRDRLRSMKPGDLIFKTSDDGYEYIEVFDSYIKNNEASSQGEIYEIPGHPRCPVKALKKYLSKLDPLRDVLFQRPKSKFSNDMTIWYDNAGLGRNYLSTLMKLISEETGCRTVYTNHCLCITKISNLPSLGYSTRGMPVNNDVDGTYNCTSNYSRSPPSAKKNNLDNNNLENDIESNQRQQLSQQRDLDMEDDSDSDEEGVSVIEHEEEYVQKQQQEHLQLQQQHHHHLQQQQMLHQQNILQHQQQQRQQIQQQQLQPQQYQQQHVQLQQQNQLQQQHHHHHLQQQQQHHLQQHHHLQQQQLQHQLQHQQHQLNTLQEERQQNQQQNEKQNYKDTLLISPTSSPSPHPSEVTANKRKLGSSNHLNDLENSSKKSKPEEKDDLDHFFCSMAETMRQLSNRTRAELKFKIHQLVHQAELDSTL